jgi:hypothetical protein
MGGSQLAARVAGYSVVACVVAFGASAGAQSPQSPGAPASAAAKAEPERSFSFGMRAQVNVNCLSEDVTTVHAACDTSARRIYLYALGRVHPKVSYFAHVGTDRLGQGADPFTGGAVAASSDNGLVTGAAIRDAWINWAPRPEVQLQIGRMLVPFLRNFGTHSGFANLSYDYASFQQTSMIPGRRVGRDDGVMLLGEIGGGRLSYRVARMDGSAGSTNTSRGESRTAGRLALSLWSPETGFWWQGTYLDQKKVLTIGVAADHLHAASITTADLADHQAYGGDLLMNLPLGRSALTVEVDVASVEQTKVEGFGEAAVGQKVGFSGTYLVAQVGGLLPWVTKLGRFQPYLRYERFDYDEERFAASSSPLLQRETAAGLNLLVKGQATKATLDYTWVDLANDTAQQPDFGRLGLQLQVAF